MTRLKEFQLIQNGLNSSMKRIVDEIKMLLDYGLDTNKLQDRCFDLMNHLTEYVEVKDKLRKHGETMKPYQLVDSTPYEDE